MTEKLRQLAVSSSDWTATVTGIIRITKICQWERGTLINFIMFTHNYVATGHSSVFMKRV